MSRKIISLFTLLAFIVFSVSCYTTRLKEIRTAADWKGKKGKIISLVKTSGEYIKFPKKTPGRIHGDKILGTAVLFIKKVEITKDIIKEVKRDKRGMISEITDKNGKTYHTVTGTLRAVATKDDLTGKEEGRIIFIATYKTSELVIIPLSEVKSIQVESIDYGLSLLAVFGTIGLMILLKAAFANAMSGIIEF